MNYTQNYQLNQWEASDRVLRTDFNADNAKIDAALAELERDKAEASALSALQTVVTAKGNCRIEAGSYVGDGDDRGTVSITTSFPAKAIFVMGSNFGVAVRGAGNIRFVSSIARTAAITWQDDGLFWWNTSSNLAAADFMNSANTTYYYVVIG